MLNGVVRAAGAMFQILVLNVISFWALRYPFTYLFSKWLGENGIALGIGMSLYAEQPDRLFILPLREVEAPRSI